MFFGGTVVPVALGLWAGGVLTMLKNAVRFHELEGAEDEGGDEEDYDLLDAHPDTETGSVTRDLGFLGPKLGQYSIEENGTVYDLQQYSQPRYMYGMLVRAPVEFGVNFIAFFVLFAMQIYALQGYSNVGHVDWPLVSFKLVHFLFYALFHLVPISSSLSEDKIKLLSLRFISGILCGLSRHAVMLIIAWRYSGWLAIALVAASVLLTLANLLGEQIKRVLVVTMLTFIMCSRENCSGSCWLALAGGAISILAGLSFYLRGLLKGWEFKEWRREGQRGWIPDCVAFDIGSAVWIIALNYNHPAAAMDIGAPGASFPFCAWARD
eukprot:g565.t1